jgi:hypothetical protein
MTPSYRYIIFGAGIAEKLFRTISIMACFTSLNLLFAAKLQSQNTEKQTTIADTIIHLSDVGNTLQLNQEQLQQAPFHKLTTYGLLAPSAYRLKGDQIYFYGISSSNSRTFIDGMLISDASDFPVRALQSYQLFTSRLPIDMGFTSVGTTSLETILPTEKFSAIADIYSDQTYSLHSINGELAINIPLSVKGKRIGNKPGPTLLIAAKFAKSDNNDPIWKKTKTLSRESLSQLTTNPFGSGVGHENVIEHAEYVMPDDLVDQKAPGKNSKTGIYPYLKLSIPLAKNAMLSLGSYSVVDKADVFDHNNAMFNATNNAVRSRRNFDNSLNWNHQIDVNADLKLSYDLQLQYANHFEKTESPEHGKNFFDYGYIGKFTSYKTDTYEIGSVEVDGQYYSNVMLLNSHDYDTLVTFEPSAINPSVSVYTTDVYDNNLNHKFRNMDELAMAGGLINGMRPNSVYGLYNNTGTVSNNYQEISEEKIRIAFNMKADYKSHHFLVGGEYNRETNSYYSVAPVGLWNLIRGLTNFHIIELDKLNPILVEHNGSLDTVKFNRKYDAQSQQVFDYNLRQKLGLSADGVDYILTDSYDRENNAISYYDQDNKLHTINTPDNLFSLDMFSPDELLNDGNAYISYAGYNFSGGKAKSSNNPYSFFDDFSINASKPEYWAAYFQDEFNWKGLRARIGLRVDVYDANRPVLNDIYSMYPIYSVKEALSEGSIEFVKPGDIGDDYMVYVDKVNDPTRVMGYRDGDKWYTAEGIRIGEPLVLDVGSGVSPYLKYPDIRVAKGDWKPEMTFRDYTKTMSLLPQISLDYSISEWFNIYTNYSSSTQNPQYISDYRPEMYYNWEGSTSTQIIPNPALKPVRTGIFFTGAKANIWKNLVGDLAYFTTSIDNFIIISKIEQAYPKSYFTYMNAENRITNRGIQAKADWINTLGTGLSGGMSFTKLFPGKDDFNYFQSCDLVLNANIGYKFGSKEILRMPASEYLGFMQGLSLQLFYQFRHGTPYNYTNNNTIESTRFTPNVNLFNLNVQKDITINQKANLILYLNIENLFNFKNVFEVYTKTGTATDDGFLADPAWQYFISTRSNPDTYRMLYQLHLYNPAYYDIPRIWRIGLIFKY